MFSLRPPKPTFRSYLLPLPQSEDHLTAEPRIKKLEPILLPGEIVVNEVNFVRKCIATDTSQYDLWGKLVCTNFKISFITDDPMPLQKFHYKNLLLGEHDVPLTCIEQIVTVNDTKRKQKVLGPNQKLKFNPTELIIYCKDFRIVRFRFDEAGPESAKKRSRSRNPVMKPTVLSLILSAFLPSCLLALFVTFQVWQSFSCQFPFYSFSEVTLEQSICNIFIATVSNWLSELRRVISL